MTMVNTPQERSQIGTIEVYNMKRDVSFLLREMMSDCFRTKSRRLLR